MGMLNCLVFHVVMKKLECVLHKGATSFGGYSDLKAYILDLQPVPFQRIAFEVLIGGDAHLDIRT